MPELLLELFSEEIPARMQARAADDLARLVGEALAALSPHAVRTFHGPRRIALAASVSPTLAESRSSERGPRVAAPEQALAGFLRKHAASHEALRQDGGFWVLDRVQPGIDAAALIGRALPGLLRRFPWPKSMRWGGSSAFAWVRPLRRILCILDGAVVPFTLAEGGDDGHGLSSDNLTEGHRFLSPGALAVTSVQQWRDDLLGRHVVVDAGERRRRVAEGMARLAAERQLTVVDDSGLLDEVAGLVEWPVPLLGRVEPASMDLPPEVMQVSMRVNQRYFALRHADGSAAPWFAFAANIAASDGGHAIVAGNERVLRARFSDARHFWNLDRAHTLESRVAALDRVTFHAKLGSQGDRVRRLAALAGEIAQLIDADPALARRAALLAKADLTTGMVGEFPELQGVMGRYYALHDSEPPAVADAVRDHYAPKGVGDPVPTDPVAIAAALADKLDQLAQFFAAGEKPTGSGDPFALRRAALGVIRIIRENGLRLRLDEVLAHAGADAALAAELRLFLFERLRVQLRGEGARHDVLTAVLDAQADDDIVRVMSKAEAVTRMLSTESGANLRAAYKRANNIVTKEMPGLQGLARIEVSPELLREQAELALFDSIETVGRDVELFMAGEKFGPAMDVFAGLRAPVDRFFDDVTVVVPDPATRENRLRLLRRLTETMDVVADFSKIEG